VACGCCGNDDDRWQGSGARPLDRAHRILTPRQGAAVPVGVRGRSVLAFLLASMVQFHGQQDPAQETGYETR
jgi:hypothetical protein